MPEADLIRQVGISEQTFYRRKKGTVRLFGSRTRKGKVSPPAIRLRGRARCPLPGRLRLGTGHALAFRIPMIAAAHEQIGNPTVHGRESLQLTRRYETAHDLLADVSGLVRILGSVVPPLVLPVLNTQLRPSAVLAAA